MTGQDLKNSILQLAIQGKLVPQDANDEPASVLLERIKAEKQKLINEKKIKKEKPLPEITEDEKPFEIPESWEWVRLGDYVKVVTDGDHSAPPQTEKGVPFVVISCIEDESINFAKAKYVHEDYYQKLDYNRKPQKNDILFTVTGSYGKVIELTNEAKFCFQRHIGLIRPYFYSTYLAFVLRSGFIKGICDDQATGIAQKTVTLSILRTLPIPLPPLSEQHRIVAKIEELMPLVEEYDKAQKELDALNAKLPEALKKSILQEAIQGKLVPQDTNDEPASVLLQRIRKEKEQLVKDGKLKKKDLVTTPITDEEKPFEIPESWEWCRFEDIAQGLCGKTPERGNQDYWLNPQYPWVSISDMTNYGLIKSTKEGISEKATGIMREISKKGDLLMSFKLTVGRTSILDIDAYHNEAIITVKPFVDKDNNLRDYLFKLLPLITATGDTKDAIKGRTLNAKSIAALIIPLPPIAEQHRIVSKIEDLFAQIEPLAKALSTPM